MYRSFNKMRCGGVLLKVLYMIATFNYEGRDVPIKLAKPHHITSY
jgi:hypothetical protein